MTVNYIEGDLLTHPCNYLVQQCNCQTSSAAGLSKAIFGRWPSANTYVSGRANKRRPGHIDVIPVSNSNSNSNGKYVVNLYGQNWPSKPRGDETAAQRLLWFHSGLQRLVQHLMQTANDKLVVAFPHFIGCGLAGGKWSDYDAEINNFANLVRPYNVVVDVVRLD